MPNANRAAGRRGVLNRLAHSIRIATTALKLGVLTIVACLAGVAKAPAAITPTTDASAVAGAVTSDPLLISGADWITRPPGTLTAISTVAVADDPLVSFPTDGTNYPIMSTGKPEIAGNPNFSDSSGANMGGSHFQGDSNYDVTVLRIDLNVPIATDCLSFKYRFLSEEYPEFVGEGFNDTFIAQLDRYDWSDAGQIVTAPGDFATTGSPVGIDGTGEFAVSEKRAAGTTYDAATGLITAKTRVTPGAHSLFLSIFDAGDGIFDSAVFLDELRATQVASGSCEPPAVTTPPTPDPPKPEPSEPDTNIKAFPTTIKRSLLKSFEGTASSEAGLSRVDVALIRLITNSKKQLVNCYHMNSKRQFFQRKESIDRCTKLQWVRAKGTDQWKFDLKRKLTPGNYVLYSRGVDVGSRLEREFNTKDGNKFAFTVKK